MKKLLFTFTLCLMACVTYAQTPRTVYCDVVGKAKFLSLKINISVDFGETVNKYKCQLVGEDNKIISFTSMVQAANYMAKRGWRLVDTYVLAEKSVSCYGNFHYIMAKDITSEDQIKEGLKLVSDRKKK